MMFYLSPAIPAVFLHCYHFPKKSFFSRTFYSLTLQKRSTIILCNHAVLYTVLCILFLPFWNPFVLKKTSLPWTTGFSFFLSAYLRFDLFLMSGGKQSRRSLTPSVKSVKVLNKYSYSIFSTDIIAFDVYSKVINYIVYNLRNILCSSSLSIYTISWTLVFFCKFLPKNIFLVRQLLKICNCENLESFLELWTRGTFFLIFCNKTC